MAVRKVIRAPIKVIKKVAKAAPKLVKKVAPLAALAAGAYFLPTIAASVLPRILARRRGAGAPAEMPAPSWPEASAPAPVTPRDALATAAQAYFASRYPAPPPPPPQQPFAYYPEPSPQVRAREAPTQAGFSLKKIPPALLVAGAAIPLVFFLMPRERGRRR